MATHAVLQDFKERESINKEYLEDLYSQAYPLETANEVLDY